MKYLLLICSIALFITSCGNNKHTKENNDFSLVKLLFPDGEYIIKDKNGNIKLQGVIIDSKPYGIWKEYNEEEVLTTAIYFYDGKKITDIDPNDYNLKKVNHDKTGISVMLPTSWFIKSDFEEALIIAVKQMPNDSIFSPTINITKWQKPDEVSFKGYVELNIKEIESTFSEVKIHEEKYSTFLSNNTFEITYFAKTNDLVLGIFSVYFEINNDIYIVTCIADGNGQEYNKYKDIFKVVAYSLSWDNG